MPALSQILAVAVGGAIGAVLRFLVSHAIDGRSASVLPWGTFAVNMAGCLLLGFCGVWLIGRGGPTLRPAINVGLIGGLTTFSTFAFEAMGMVGEGARGWAAVYIAGSVILGLAAAYAGMATGRAVFGG